jgi:hypothetical protein
VGPTWRDKLGSAGVDAQDISEIAQILAFLDVTGDGLMREEVLELVQRVRVSRDSPLSKGLNELTAVGGVVGKAARNGGDRAVEEVRSWMRR